MSEHENGRAEVQRTTFWVPPCLLDAYQSQN